MMTKTTTTKKLLTELNPHAQEKNSANHVYQLLEFELAIAAQERDCRVIT